MNKSIVLIVSLLSILFFGCMTTETFSSQGKTVVADTRTQVPDAQTAQSLTPADADALVAATIQAINQKTITAVFKLIDYSSSSE